MMGFVAATSVHPDLVLYFAVAAAVALSVHEFAHAFVATRFGDQSPRAMGRLSLDLRRHADPFGTLVLPAILLLLVFFVGCNFVVFAYAKPMPLNPWHTRRSTRDTVLVQAAGPLANLVLAVGFAAIYRSVGGTGALSTLLAVWVTTNATFAVIHLIPIPPLDAARAIVPFLSYRPRDFFVSMEQYAPVIMLLMFFILGQFFAGLVIAMRDAVIGGLAGAC
jgi:Zn-dependent protease